MWLAAGDKCSVDQLVDGIRAVALCLEGCGCGVVADAAVVVIKETSAMWVEEAKTLVHDAVVDTVESAKNKMQEVGQKSWAEQVDDHIPEPVASGTGRNTSYAQ